MWKSLWRTGWDFFNERNGAWFEWVLEPFRSSNSFRTNVHWLLPHPSHFEQYAQWKNDIEPKPPSYCLFFIYNVVSNLCYEMKN